MIDYNFAWDYKKAKINIQKHRVSFEDAAAIFADSNAMTIYDSVHSIAEDRWVTLGIAYSGNLLVVSHTFQEINSAVCLIRIFSARKATKNEKRQYGG